MVASKALVAVSPGAERRDRRESVIDVARRLLTTDPTLTKRLLDDDAAPSPSRSLFVRAASDAYVERVRRAPTRRRRRGRSFSRRRRARRRRWRVPCRSTRRCRSSLSSSSRQRPHRRERTRPRPRGRRRGRRTTTTRRVPTERNRPRSRRRCRCRHELRPLLVVGHAHRRRPERRVRQSAENRRPILCCRCSPGRARTRRPARAPPPRRTPPPVASDRGPDNGEETAKADTTGDQKTIKDNNRMLSHCTGNVSVLQTSLSRW